MFMEDISYLKARVEDTANNENYGWAGGQNLIAKILEIFRIRDQGFRGDPENGRF